MARGGRGRSKRTPVRALLSVITVPSHRPSPTLEAVMDAKTVDRRAQHQPRLEDDPLVRGQVVAQLASLGYGIVSAAGGAAALALVELGIAFDLVFTDMVLPGGMSGQQLADEVGKRRPSLPVLYTSGYGENIMPNGGRIEPGAGILSKPYRKAELARKMNVPTNRVTQILNGTRSITGDTALRLAHFFDTSAQFWLNLQTHYDLEREEQRLGRRLDREARRRSR